MEGTPFGRYQLLELLGRGGMGEVWRAHDTAIDRIVALKMLLPHFAQDSAFDQRFRREARAAARLDDPHIVPIYDVGEIDGRLYVTMRLIDGDNLQTLLDAGPLDPQRAVNIIEQIASALHNAHQAGLVHRDVKPANILLARNDFAYLIDFGIARAADDTSLTSASTTMGTWAYMAPERFRAGEVGPSADVYALACVLYQCLTGQTPFPGAALEQVAVGHMVNQPPKPSEQRDTIPTALDEVISTGLAKLPNDRYPSTVEMAAAARQAITEPISQSWTAQPTQPLGDSRPGVPVSPHSAPTQPVQAYSGVAATQFGAPAGPPPAPPVPTPPGRPGRRRRGVLIGALAAVALLIVASGVVAGLKFLHHPTPAATAPPSTATAGPPPAGAAAAAPNTGPFTGTYRADYSPPAVIDAKPAGDAQPSTATWGVRSGCGPAGCVATASRLSGTSPPVTNLVFDQIGGNWLAVGLGSDKCQDTPAEIWEVVTLQPHPDGTLTGDYSETTSDGCSGEGTVTFTRTGDVDINSLPDPASQPPRVVSPAEALHGHYHLTRTMTDGGDKQENDFVVTTYCLRAGDRCMSYFHEPGNLRPLVFGGGNWIYATEQDDNCPGHGPTHLTATAQYSLPQPPQNPITTLTGYGHQEQTGACADTSASDETFTRTGD